MDTKQTLAALIDAYADAKRTGNEMLIKMVASQLQEFFSTHDVVPTTPVAPAVVEAPGDTED
jgi:hypothetical protein